MLGRLFVVFLYILSFVSKIQLLIEGQASIKRTRKA